MEMHIKISVVVTCYNYGRYLEACLNSVFRQTFKGIEIIVIDDGSTDNTGEVVKQFLNRPNFKYVYQENRGQASAKNAGIRNATGEYIAFLDADDLWVEEKLEKQIALFVPDSTGVAFSQSNYIDENGKLLNLKLHEQYLLPRKGRVTEFLFLDNFVPFSSAVVRRKCFERCGVFDESIKMAIDWDLWLRISTEFYFDYVNEPLLLYRIGHSDQMSKNIMERNNCCDIIMQRFLKNYPGLLSNNTLRKAYAFTYCNRGKFYRKYDIKKSIRYYLAALKQRPIEVGAYKGLLKILVSILQR